MKLTINGEACQVARDSQTLVQLLVTEKVQQPDTVTVQVNGAFVDKNAYATTVLKEGDEVDFLYFMGGGR